MIDEDDKRTRDRSPAFPYISLREAVERLEQLHRSHQRHPARIKNVGPVWGFSAASSSLLRNVAAMRLYGLVDEYGAGDDRKIAVSDLGMKIVADKRPGVREASIRTAFETCVILNDLRKKWGKKRPPDDECLSELHLDAGFTEGAARKLISVYDDSVEYANMSEADSGSSGKTLEADWLGEFEIGTYVQWKRDEVFQLPQAAKLTGFRADGAFAYVEGRVEGIPRDELVKADPPKDARSGSGKPPADRGGGGVKMIEATYPLKEGTCTLSWPSEMSEKSAQRLKKWLELMLDDLVEAGGIDGNSQEKKAGES